jgi:hypothetical protein
MTKELLVRQSNDVLVDRNMAPPEFLSIVDD